jgi:hypothetical protein
MRSMTVLLVAAAGVLGVLLSACGANGEGSMIQLTTDKPNDRAVVTIEDGRALIDVVSPGGIGGLQATLESGQWPEEIVVRLHLRGLEQLEIAYGAYTLTTGKSSNSSPDPALELTVVEEDGTVQSASPSADMWYPTLTIGGGSGEIPLPEDGYFDVAMPPHFFRGDYPSFRVQWIDFYR